VPTFLKANDTRPILEIHLQEDGSPLDLTDVTDSKLLMKSGAVLIERECEVVDAPNGVVEVTFLAEDTASAGTYQAEVELTYSDGGVETVPNNGYAAITIQPDLG
jgi:hypothetical protein